jgi:hypothetical protein
MHPARRLKALTPHFHIQQHMRQLMGDKSLQILAVQGLQNHLPTVMECDAQSPRRQLDAGTLVELVGRAHDIDRNGPSDGQVQRLTEILESLLTVAANLEGDVLLLGPVTDVQIPSTEREALLLGQTDTRSARQ